MELPTLEDHSAHVPRWAGRSHVAPREGLCLRLRPAPDSVTLLSLQEASQRSPGRPGGLRHQAAVVQSEV